MALSDWEGNKYYDHLKRMKVRKCDVYTVNDNTIRKGRKLDGVNSIRVKKQKKEKEKKKEASG